MSLSSGDDDSTASASEDIYTYLYLGIYSTYMGVEDHSQCLSPLTTPIRSKQGVYHANRHGQDSSVTSSSVRESADGRYIFASGTNPPQYVYDTAQLSLNFKRHVDVDVPSFRLLADDFTKFALLRHVKTLDFHMANKSNQCLKLPSNGCQVFADLQTAQLFVPGATGQVPVLDMEVGRIKMPLTAPDCDTVCEFIYPINGMLALSYASPEGILHLYHPRTRPCPTPRGTLPAGGALSALRFHGTDVQQLTLDLADRRTLLYDLRRAESLAVTAKGNGAPIQFQKALHSYQSRVSNRAIGRAVCRGRGTARHRERVGARRRAVVVRLPVRRHGRAGKRARRNHDETSRTYGAKEMKEEKNKVKKKTIMKKVKNLMRIIRS